MHYNKYTGYTAAEPSLFLFSLIYNISSEQYSLLWFQYVHYKYWVTPDP